MTTITRQTIEDDDGVQIGRLEWDCTTSTVKIHIGDLGECAHHDRTMIDVNEVEFHELLTTMGRVGHEVFGIDMKKYFNGK